MISNLERYKKDLESLLATGNKLFMSLQHSCYEKEFENGIKKHIGEKTKEFIHPLPKFDKNYQSWYSEAKSLIKQLLPDRLDDFVRALRKTKAEKGHNI